ncbi:MAG: hypothetical protein ABI461_08380, partial [Polyangiaceae bacterium]
VVGLIFSVLASAPKRAAAQPGLHIQLGGEYLSSFGRDSESAALGLYGGVAYSPSRLLSVGALGAYGALTSTSCEVDGYGACPWWHPYRVTGELELTPLLHRHPVDPFFVVDLGIFGQHDSLFGEDPRVAPAGGVGGGAHFFAARFLSADVALRFFYAGFGRNEYGYLDFNRTWWALSLGVTPWISL